MDKQILVQNIKKYCALRGIKPTIACAESGAGKDIINQLEKRGSIPSIERVQLLAQYLGVSTSDLLGEEADDPPIVGGETNQLLILYAQLNDEGRERLLETADAMVKSGKYNKK